jgi:hypothetical protein
MSPAFEDVLYLFSCGALGKEPVAKHDLNIDEIYKISCAQGIWGVVFLPIKQLYQSGVIEIKKELIESWEKNFLAMAINQLKKRRTINDVLCEMRKNDIDAYLLKGDVIAQYYKEPLSRVSSDTDIYVGTRQIESAEKIFDKCGFTVYARSPMEHHTVCKHPIGGSIDLHLTFHDDCFEEKFFKGYTEITEQSISYQIDEYFFNSLGATDNAIFLFLHWIKHFLSCGTGIRQIMDFFLFWKNNVDNIDVSKFHKMLVDLGFCELYAASAHIAVKYMQFNESEVESFDFKADDFFVNWLLLDIEQGGVFGKLEQRKLTFYYLFSNDGIPYIDETNSSRYLKMYLKTFQYSYLSRKYPYLSKSKLLLPAAYVNRVYDLILSSIRVIKTMKNATTKNDEYTNINSRMKVIDSVYKR